MSGNVQLSYEGIGEMLCADFMVADMHARAEKIAAEARATSPVGPAKDGNHYIDSFEVSSHVREGDSRRAEGVVTNTSQHAAAIEFGNHRTRKETIGAHHVLGRAIDAGRY